MARTALPSTGRPHDDILADLRQLAAGDPDYAGGRVWSLVYYLGEEHTRFLQQAYGSFFSANGLNPTAFKSLKRLETEVIEITASLLHGPDTTVGVVTSGGTESCLLAVKTYRDHARATRGVTRPEMVLPVTAHVAWGKGAEYFGVKPVYAPLGPDLRVDVRAVRRRMNRNTVMILGSAPDYPHGMIDPIDELGALGQRRRVPVHVDACVGGYLLPFIEKLGHPLPRWDYRVPGVTSISADTHKYGFAAKGASTITYRSLDLLEHQMYVDPDWPGGVFASPALLGTRPGGAYAAAWAALQALGEDGYLDLTARILDATWALRRGIADIEGIEILGDPRASLLAYRSTDPDLDIFAVGDQLEARGWHVDRVQRPDALHAMVTPGHAAVVDDYLADLREAVAHVRRHPELSETGGAATYGMIAHVPLRGMVKRQVREEFAKMYAPGGAAMDVAEAEIGRLPPLVKRAVQRYVRWRRHNQTGSGR